MKKTLERAGLIAALALPATACSDDDDDGRQRYVIEVEGGDGDTTPISALDDDQLGQVCGSYAAYLDAEVSFEAIAYVACLPPAIVLGAGDRAQCRELLDNCMDAFPEPISIQAQAADDSVCVESLRSCNASIVDLEGCVNVNLGFLFDILDNWTCGDADDSDRQAEAAEVMDTVSVCTDVDASCGLGNLPGPD